MYGYACAIATALLTCAAGLKSQSPPQPRIATFDGASLYIQGDPSKPVIMQGYTDAHQVGTFSWDKFKDKLSNIVDRKMSSVSEALVKEVFQDDEAAAMLMNMFYAQKHKYSYILYSYKDTGGWNIDGACSHKGNATPSHWCKVRAMEDAMERRGQSDLFLWLDSDVMVRKMDLELMDYLVSAKRCHGEFKKVTSYVSVFAWVNTHWFECPFTGRQANSGVVALQRVKGVTDNSGMKSFLEQWWLNRNWSMSGGYGKNDQHSFNEALKWFPSKSRVVFAEDTFRDHPDNYFSHKCGACDWMPKMSSIVETTMRANNISSSMLRDVLLRTESLVVDMP